MKRVGIEWRERFDPVAIADRFEPEFQRFDLTLESRFARGRCRKRVELFSLVRNAGVINGATYDPLKRALQRIYNDIRTKRAPFDTPAWLSTTRAYKGLICGG